MTRIQEKQAAVEARKADSAKHLYAEEDLRTTEEILGAAVKAAVAATPAPAAKVEDGFFTKRVDWCWGLPRWGVGAGAVGVLGAVYLAYKKFIKKGRR
jgi:hypothetical protein